MFFAAGCFGQTADTVRVVNPPFELTDDTVVNAMPDAMPFEVRTVGDRPNSRTSTTRAVFGPTAKEKRQARRAARRQPIETAGQNREPFRVAAGIREAVIAPPADSLATDSLGVTDSLRTVIAGTGDVPGGGVRDSVEVFADVREEGYTLTGTEIQADSVSMEGLSRRERRLAEREMLRADTTLFRHHPLLKDTMSISKVSLISIVVPGFGQFYNQDYWKIPVLYGVTGTALYFGIKEHQEYRKYKKVYDYRIFNGFPREFIDPVQNNMIIHNTYRQLYFGAALASYIYFIADGAINYPSDETRIKVATTLSTICPGLGQIYNGSYWRVPIVVGGFASLIYVIDWNDRMYQRFKLAFEQKMQGLNIGDARYDLSTIQNYKDNARRNRDLCIILTAGLYFLNIIDAHVDAHLQDFDVSDQLAMRIRLEPVTNSFYTQTGGNTNWFGFNLSYNF